MVILKRRWISQELSYSTQLETTKTVLLLLHLGGKMSRIMLSAHKGIHVKKSKDKSTTGRSKDQPISLFGEPVRKYHWKTPVLINSEIHSVRLQPICFPSSFATQQAPCCHTSQRSAGQGLFVYDVLPHITFDHSGIQIRNHGTFLWLQDAQLPPIPLLSPLKT